MMLLKNARLPASAVCEMYRRVDHVDPAAQTRDEAIADEGDRGRRGRDEDVRERVGPDARDDEAPSAVAVHEEPRHELRDAVRDREPARHEPKLQRRRAERERVQR